MISILSLIGSNPYLPNSKHIDHDNRHIAFSPHCSRLQVPTVVLLNPQNHPGQDKEGAEHEE